MMDSVELIESIRYYLAEDDTLRDSNHLNVSTAAAALKRIMMNDAITSSRETIWSYPMIVFKLNDGEAVAVPSNEEFLTVKIVSKSIVSATRIKDRMKILLANKCADDHKHDSINAQGQILGYNIKIRGLFWVSGVTNDDVEQGSERLHRINCVIQMIVGD